MPGAIRSGCGFIGLFRLIGAELSEDGHYRTVLDALSEQSPAPAGSGSRAEDGMAG
jgi:hypothetical protein